MLQFPYLEEPLLGIAPPSLPANTISRWRPLIPIRIFGPSGHSRFFFRALLDPGSDDTIFPLVIAAQIQLVLRTTSGHAIRWRGQRHPLQFADADLEISDIRSSCRWPVTIGFTSAPIHYPLLGIAGFLQFFKATFVGDQRLVELETNVTFPGIEE